MYPGTAHWYHLHSQAQNLAALSTAIPPASEKRQTAFADFQQARIKILLSGWHLLPAGTGRLAE